MCWATAAVAHVLLVPVEKIEVVVVNDLRRVQDALGRLGDVARVLLRRKACLAVLGVEHAQRALVVLGRLRRLVLEGEHLVARGPREKVGSQLLLVLLLGRGGVDARVFVLVGSGQLEVGDVKVHGGALGDEAVAAAATR